MHVVHGSNAINSSYAIELYIITFRICVTPQELSKAMPTSRGDYCDDTSRNDTYYNDTQNTLYAMLVYSICFTPISNYYNYMIC